jgi:hypothetical protein
LVENSQGQIYYVCSNKQKLPQVLLTIFIDLNDFAAPFPVFERQKRLFLPTVASGSAAAFGEKCCLFWEKLLALFGKSPVCFCRMCRWLPSFLPPLRMRRPAAVGKKILPTVRSVPGETGGRGGEV